MKPSHISERDDDCIVRVGRDWLLSGTRRPYETFLNHKDPQLLKAVARYVNRSAAGRGDGAASPMSHESWRSSVG